MKHHSTSPDFEFVLPPQEFDKFVPRERLQYFLGATLYMPGTKDVANKILQRQMGNLTSMVMDFEDAIAEEVLNQAESNVLQHLSLIGEALQRGQIAVRDVPLIFLRARNPKQFRRFVQHLKRHQAEALTGFVFPKFYSSNANEYLTELEDLNQRLDCSLYAMPLLEGRAIAFAESRIDELARLRQMLMPYRERILNVRVGGTDFSSLFGVRRSINSSVYDILTVRDCLADILNVFNRSEDEFTVSAPVWEYFLAYKSDDLNRLLHSNLHRSLLNSEPILNDAIDGLLREILLDKANGFIGKTIIHPSHVTFVNSMQAVMREEYEDALQILNTNGGVIKSRKGNKMNEINPHRNWAKRIVSLAEAYGVIEDEASCVRLFTPEEVLVGQSAEK